MPSPFPGMDPYLEEETIWPAFQHQFVTTLNQMLLPNLGDRYRMRVGVRSYFTEQVLFTSIQREEHLEEYLEIRLRSDGRLTTLVQLASPKNRTTEAGRREYLALNTSARRAGANLLEIDLVFRGQPILPAPANGNTAFDYSVAVTRGSCPERVDVATTTLQKPLPRFKLPLGRNDRDLIVDLGSVCSRAYDQGDFSQMIDYTRAPQAPLPEDDQAWIERLLIAAQLRGT